jgi:DNA-binding MarR family transcriptional regulator
VALHADPAAQPAGGPGLRRRLIAQRVARLLNQVRRSANPAFRRATGLSGEDWRIVGQVGVFLRLQLTELAALLAQDKGQVSRAAKRLIGAGVLAREQRGALTLTASGKKIYTRILRLSQLRNTVLIRKLTDRELELLRALVARLLANARLLLGKQPGVEEDDAQSNARRQALIAARLTDRADLRRRQSELAPRRRLVLPDLINLLNLLRGSSGPAFKRATGASYFDSLILSQVGERASLTLIELVPIMNRDKSQVGRAVKRLAAQGLITTGKIGHGRHVILTISDKGRRVYDRLLRLSLQRNAVLTSGLSSLEQQTLHSILDELTAAGELMLAREHARTQKGD